MASAIQRQEWNIAGPRIRAAIAGQRIPGQYRHSFRRGMLGKFVQIKAMMAAVRVNTARLALAVPQIRGQLNQIRGQGEQNPDQVDRIADQVDQITDQSDRISVGRDYVEYLVSRVEAIAPPQGCPIGKAGLLPLVRWVRDTLHRRAVAVAVPAGPPAALESSGITRSITDGDGGMPVIKYTWEQYGPRERVYLRKARECKEQGYPTLIHRTPFRRARGHLLDRRYVAVYCSHPTSFIMNDDPRWLAAMTALLRDDTAGGAVNG